MNSIPNLTVERRNPNRRAVLGGVAALISSAGGCIQRTRNIGGRDSPKQLSLAVKTVPADVDETATAIAREFVSNLSAVGIDARIVLMNGTELYRDLLVRNDFDVYVAQFPGRRDPDFLRPLLHSTFGDGSGWVNPFDFSEKAIDELLVEQRRSSSHHRSAVLSALRKDIVGEQPFSVVAVPDALLAVRPDRYDGWSRVSLDSPISYLRLRPTNPVRTSTESNKDTTKQLRLVTTQERPTENLNPLTVRSPMTVNFTNLVYDPLARWYDGDINPWLAASWQWESEVGASEPVATIRLRSDARWHDGRLVSASDVAFTYRFLADTSLGREDTPVPAPRFGGRVSLVEGVEAFDGRTVRIAFGPCSRRVAKRALTVPILPCHEWEPKSAPSNIAGVTIPNGRTEALAWNNPTPIGSGLLRVDRSAAKELLLLSRFPDHFLHDDSDAGIGGPFGGGSPFDELALRVVPSSAVAAEVIAADQADATAMSVNPDILPRVERYDDLRSCVTVSQSFYHLGFNTSRAPLSDHRFRRTIARLLDREQLVSSVFGGYATPTIDPLAGSDGLRTDSTNSNEYLDMSFLGDRGQLDREAAQKAFRRSGYRYDEFGALLGR